MADVGRPAIMTPEVLHKLEEAFAKGCTDLEACLWADISKSTLYNYCIDHPEFLERKEKLKESPTLKARFTVVDDLDHRDTAKWYLERKNKAEFSPRVETTGPGGDDISILIKFDGSNNNKSDLPPIPEGSILHDQEVLSDSSGPTNGQNV